mgnify:CR=1 FL=1
MDYPGDIRSYVVVSCFFWFGLKGELPMKDSQKELKDCAATIGEIVLTLAAGMFFIWVLMLCSSLVVQWW